MVLKKEVIKKEVTSKKWNEDLPSWINQWWFHQTFITTYMSFVSQSVNPWDVPSKCALEVMQTIWNATSGNEYQITTSTAVYQKVCWVFCLIHYWYLFYTVQCLTNSWRNIIGSTGIAVILAFLDFQEILQDSDEDHREFPEYYLSDLHFLYRDSDHEDKKVTIFKLFCYIYIYIY